MHAARLQRRVSIAFFSTSEPPPLHVSRHNIALLNSFQNMKSIRRKGENDIAEKNKIKVQIQNFGSRYLPSNSLGRVHFASIFRPYHAYVSNKNLSCFELFFSDLRRATNVLRRRSLRWVNAVTAELDATWSNLNSDADSQRGNARNIGTRCRPP